MARGRPKHAIPRTRWDAYIRTDLAAKVELLITDPLRKKAKYGARSEYLEALIAADLNKRIRDHKGEVAYEPTELERFIHALEFEIAHWNLETPERVKKLVAAAKAALEPG